jgi:hypothetical protein
VWVVRQAGSVVYRGSRAADALRYARTDPTVTIIRNGKVIYPPPEELDLNPDNPPRD